MQITVFHCIHKEIANYSFRESGLQITLSLLSSSLGNSSFAYTKHKSTKKKYWTMFFNRIAVHMQNF